LPGKPDIVFRELRKVIFVHGCFWHQHKKCRRSALPTTNAQWWASKLGENAIRDRLTARRLSRAGWRRMTVWQCQLKATTAVLLRLQRFLKP
jgi:DNA mismatch endonuclease (patch repair protein)